jgi:hypothetical protein
MALTQAVLLAMPRIGSESQFSKLTDWMRRRLSSLEHNSNRQNMVVAECL